MELKFRNFAKLIEDMARIKGRHTELVSVYVPQDYNILKVVEQLRNEQSTAQNIKSKQVKKNVMAALEKILAHLKVYNKTPDKGLAIFCGNVSEKEGVSDIQIFVIDPLEPIKTRLYMCDQEFVLGPLKEMVEEKELYGLIVLDGQEANIGLLKGKKVEQVKHMDSIVPGKTRKGGWSANRYARIREGLLEDFLKHVGEIASKEFLNRKDLKGVIVGGPGPIKEDFLEGGYLNYEIKKIVLGTVNTSYTGEYGLKEMVERSEPLISEASAVKENKLMERFFTELAKDALAVRGEEAVLRLLDQGAVEIVLISENFDPIKTERILEHAESMGSKVELISTESPRGGQLKELGGIGAILRYRA